MRILVVDDDALARSQSCDALTLVGHEVEIASSGHQGLDLVAEAPPGAVLLELDLPDIDGLEICRRVRRLDQRMPILLVSRRDSISDRVCGLDAGGDAYLTKPFVAKELIARLEALLRRSAHRDAPIARLSFAEIQLDEGQYGVLVGDRFQRLTKTEFVLLQLFMSSPERLFSPVELYDRVWKRDGRDSALLHVYVGYLRKRLREVGARPLIHTVAGSGYMMREP